MYLAYHEPENIKNSIITGAREEATPDLAREAWLGLKMSPSDTVGAVVGVAGAATGGEVGEVAEEEGGEVDAAVVVDLEAEVGVEADDDGPSDSEPILIMGTRLSVHG